MIVVDCDLAVDNERGDAEKIPLCREVSPGEASQHVCLRSVAYKFLKEILRVKYLKVQPRQGDPVSGEKASGPQSFLLGVSVFQVVRCRDLECHPIVGKEMESEKL
jgi:hypothetical protein